MLCSTCVKRATLIKKWWKIRIFYVFLLYIVCQNMSYALLVFNTSTINWVLPLEKKAQKGPNPPLFRSNTTYFLFWGRGNGCYRTPELSMEVADEPLRCEKRPRLIFYTKASKSCTFLLLYRVDKANRWKKFIVSQRGGWLGLGLVGAS